MIKVTSLTKRFGEKLAVDHLNLEIPRGEFFGFLGPNGAGKTTTIRMLVGLSHPTEGEVEIGGIALREDPVRAKLKIGYVPDSPYLYDKLSAREFLSFIGGLFRMEKESCRKEADFLLDYFEMTPWCDQKAEGYSHGMRQKTVVAAALLHHPEVIIIDEPLTGLDPHSGRLLKNILKERTKSGATVFVSTHILGVAEELSDRIGILDRGKLIACGSVQELMGMATAEGESLEQLFLRLTRQQRPHSVLSA
jgi:ABC-2 type transport system ATP-binding protein